MAIRLYKPVYHRNHRGSAPYGFEHWDGGWRPVRREQQALARMRELRAKGCSYREIATRLDDEGFRNRRGLPFSRQSVHLHLRAYRQARREDRE